MSFASTPISIFSPSFTSCICSGVSNALIRAIASIAFSQPARHLVRLFSTFYLLFMKFRAFVKYQSSLSYHSSNQSSFPEPPSRHLPVNHPLIATSDEHDSNQQAYCNLPHLLLSFPHPNLPDASLRHLCLFFIFCLPEIFLKIFY